jgi:hypothetical protein
MARRSQMRMEAQWPSSPNTLSRMMAKIGTPSSHKATLRMIESMAGRCAQQTAERSVIGMVSAAQMRAVNRPCLSKFTRNPGIQPGFLLTVLGNNLSRVPSRVSASFIGVTPARKVCTSTAPSSRRGQLQSQWESRPQQHLSVRERTAPRIILQTRTSTEGTSRNPIRSAPGRALKN